MIDFISVDYYVGALAPANRVSVTFFRDTEGAPTKCVKPTEALLSQIMRRYQVVYVYMSVVSCLMHFSKPEQED